MSADGLDGFRREDLEDYSGEEQELLDVLRDERMLLDLVNVGLDMRRFLRTPAGKTIWEEKERELAECIRVWLSSTDHACAPVAEAHFNARVAISVLQTFQKALDAGREAQDQLMTQEDQEQ